MGEREEEDENEDRDIPSGRQSCGMVDWCTYLIVNRRGGSVIGYIRKPTHGEIMVYIPLLTFLKHTTKDV